MEKNDENWVKYFNEEYQRYYWHNPITNESQWDDGVYDAGKMSIDNLEDSENNYDGDVETGIENGTDDYESEVLLPKVPSKQRKGAKALTTTELFASGTPIERLESTAETGSSCSMSCMMYVYVIFFEAPLLVVEAILRGAVFAIIGLGALCRHMYLQIVTPKASRKRAQKWMLICVKEICVCLSTAIVALIPGILLYVYIDLSHPSGRNYSIYSDLESDDWLIHPLPTWCLVGNVDIRRFCIVHFGYGSLSANMTVVHHSKVHEHLKNHKSQSEESHDNTVVTPPDCNLFGIQDTWKGPFVLTPGSITELIYGLLDSNSKDIDQNV